MNLFNQIVLQALENQPDLASLKVVVEKELLHHDVLRIMRDSDAMQGLTFIGGTSLRACYGGTRLSEDLDFTGGSNFSKDHLAHLADVLIKNLQNKYGLDVTVAEPIKDIHNVDTWKIKIETRKKSKHMPVQRINIDICSVPSYESVPMIFLNLYGVDMGTSGLVVQTQSREEIYADKLLAFAFRPNRIKHRDLWDIAWLHGQGIAPRLSLLPLKLQDRHKCADEFLKKFHERVQLLLNNPDLEQEFYQEMARFLSTSQVQQIMNQRQLWQSIKILLQDLERQVQQSFAG